MSEIETLITINAVLYLSAYGKHWETIENSKLFCVRLHAMAISKIGNKIISSEFLATFANGKF